MRLGFGLITCQRVPGDPRSDVDLYREAIELAEEAERLGYDSVWVSEHHFVDDGYMPSLLPTCAAIAARTSRITVGTGLVLAPLYEPVRLAEDAATVDLIAAGRFVLGLGLGWRPEEFEGLGLKVTDRVRRTREAITICKQAWSDGLVEPRGGIAVTPKPARPGGPPIWIGAIAEPSVRRAAKIADGWMATRVTPESFAESVRWVDEELEKAARDEFAISMHVPVFAWPGDDAWERVRDSFNFVEYKYAHMLGARSMTPPSPPAPRLTPERERELLAEQPIVGKPEQVAARILAYREQGRVDFEFIARNYWPGMEPAVQRETMAVFAEEVAPLLRSA